MDATQVMDDSVLESDEEGNEDDQTNKGRPVAKLHILNNEHMPETELPLFLGENVLGRDGSSCTAALPSPSVSKRHATISITLYRSRGKTDMEALVWDLGSLNGTHKGRLKLTPNVRYALSEQDSLVLADIPCRFVGCSADAVSSEQIFKTPVSVRSAVSARLTDASNGKESGAVVGCGKSDRAPEGKFSSPAFKEATNTPVHPICLSFEQTPIQPHDTLVPESDLDSDEEREGGGSRRQKTLGSDSDLNKSSPTCSTFLSPTNKIVPESEDESPITPPLSTKNRPHRHVSFNKEETNINVGRQQLKEKTASEEEDERAALKGNISAGSGPRVLEDQESGGGLGADELPASPAAVVADAFKMDSDTDVEGEEEGVASAVPVTLTTKQEVDRTPDRAEFYMDSDTDVEGDDDAASRVVPELAPPPETKPSAAIPAFPAGIPTDSDTDVDDEDMVAAKAKPVLIQSKASADSTPSAHLKQFHLGSDTEDEEDLKPEHGSSSFKRVEPPAELTGAVSAPLPPHPDSETDDEAPPVITKSGVPEPGPAADAHADLDILSDSDTDAEHHSPLVKQTFAGTNMSLTSAAASKTIQSDSDADTDVEGPSAGPVLEKVAAAEEDVEDEVNPATLGEGQASHLVRENTPGLLKSSHQYCSTPLQLSENHLEHMETQPFLSPTSGRCGAAADLRTEAPSFDSDSHEDENVFAAETQSFVLGACRGSRSEAADDDISKRSCREETFQLGLSDSSYLQDPGQALAMESTQAFASVEATQLYANQTSTHDSELDATQDYGEGAEPSTCSAAPGRGSGEDLSLEATQAYISDPRQDSEDETDDEDEKRDVTTEETQPFFAPTSATLAMAETQPMCVLEEEEEEEEEEDIKHLLSTPVQVNVRLRNEAGERGGQREAAASQGRPLKDVPSLPETQPMCTGDDGESDDEDSFPGLRRRKTKQLRIEDEQTQALASSEEPLAETQPLPSADESPAPGGSGAFREDDPVAAEEEGKPGADAADPSAAETQLMIAESDEADSDLALPRGEAEPLSLETQPMISGENGDDVASPPGTEVTKAKPAQIPEEETGLLAHPKSSSHETEAEAASSGDKVTSRRGKRGRLGKLSTRTRGTTSKSGEEQEEERENKKGEHTGEDGGIQRRADVDGKERNISEIKKQGGQSLGEEREDGGLGQLENFEEERKEREKMEREKTTSGMKEKERIEAEDAQRLKLEWEREKMERERKEQEERAERIQDTEEFEREQKEREDKERLESEKAEREDKETLERGKNGQMDNERKEREVILESERRKDEESLEREDQHGARREAKGKGEEPKEENKAPASARGRRAARRSAAAEPCAPASDDVPARQTRSRSNSSNSISSERSASSAGAPQGRGRGRGARRTSDPPGVASRSSSRRKTTTAAEGDGDPAVPGGLLSSSGSQQSSQGRGRGSRQRARGGKAEAGPASPAAPKTTTRSRKSIKSDSSREVEEEAPRWTATSRGHWRSNSHGSDPAEAEDRSSQGERCEEEPLQPQKNSRSRRTVAVSPALSDPEETKELRKGRKRESEANAKHQESSSKLFKREGKEQIPGEAEEAVGREARDEIPAPAKRRGRASGARPKADLGASEAGPGDRRTAEGARSRPSTARKKGKVEQPDAEMAEEQPAPEPEVRTPAGSASRKRRAPAEASPLTKTPRSSPLSPAAAVRSRHAYKVLFTGLVDEAGERVLARLGGGVANGVADMNCLVTDKVRRTVKFLCAVAKGIPVVTTQWLEKSGKTGSFLPPNSFIVKDPEQEDKFNFRLEESLAVASHQPLLQGYEVHVTKSVKPEPVQMKDILVCSGAAFLPKMPTFHKERTVVISCEEDYRLCAPALTASVPVVTAEFVLAGILQQKLDFGAHALPPPPEGGPRPTAGRARGRKKT